MNDLKVLHEIGVELDPPAVDPPDRLRGRVLSGLVGQPRRRVMPRFRWRLAAVGGLAVALAAGLIVAQTVNIGDHAPAANAEAAEILQFAALAAQKQPDLAAHPGQFVFVETMTLYGGTIVDENGERTLPAVPELRRVWLSVDGTGDGLLRQRPQAGGDWAETPLPGCRDGKTVQSKGGQTVTTACEPIRAYLGDLPTGAAAMSKYLYRNSHGGNPRDVQVFATVGDLIRESYVRPQAMAALLQATAEVDGTTVIRDVVDLAGRHGIAVAQTWRGNRTELIFDPKTYEYLGERTVAGNGEVTGGAARLRIAIVDHAGELPR
jgi:hypothetical protein